MTPVETSTASTTTPKPELLRSTDSAKMCGNMGRSTWDRLTAMGKTPEPIRLGSTPMWSRRELQAWIDHHCPDRDAWTAIWNRIRIKNTAR